MYLKRGCKSYLACDPIKICSKAESAKKAFIKYNILLYSVFNFLNGYNSTKKYIYTHETLERKTGNPVYKNNRFPVKRPHMKGLTNAFIYVDGHVIKSNHAGARNRFSKCVQTKTPFKSLHT